METFEDLSRTYPTPQHGWTVQTMKNGKIYRYESNEWKHTQTHNDLPIADIQNQLSATDRQTSTLSHGTSMVSGELNTPADIEIQGNTLVNLLGRNGNLDSFDG